MAKKGRFVFDTNVVVSALLIKRSAARRAFDKARKAGDILLSFVSLKNFMMCLAALGLTATLTKKTVSSF